MQSLHKGRIDDDNVCFAWVSFQTRKNKDNDVLMNCFIIYNDHYADGGDDTNDSSSVE